MNRRKSAPVNHVSGLAFLSPSIPTRVFGIRSQRRSRQFDLWTRSSFTLTQTVEVCCLHLHHALRNINNVVVIRRVTYTVLPHVLSPGSVHLPYSRNRLICSNEPSVRKLSYVLNKKKQCFRHFGETRASFVVRDFSPYKSFFSTAIKSIILVYSKYSSEFGITYFLALHKD